MKYGVSKLEAGASQSVSIQVAVCAYTRVGLALLKRQSQVTRHKFSLLSVNYNHKGPHSHDAPRAYFNGHFAPHIQSLEPGSFTEVPHGPHAYILNILRLQKRSPDIYV
jgi:hypothetical protein